ncbi:hypothetical protein FA15DRAFT_666501 [Coprinopsis marcescibilis]|uniref:Uncharacterized protein n=1 Tax=Coprinopsis marcescibilis TaxID=230819 RepID=A0A5C3L467_COPMA|nr:hypothetical protein FA15DRAFT_666501 [Coprinopsis marcescibilis]
MSVYSNPTQSSFGFNQEPVVNVNTLDPNSPELFKQNIIVAQQEVLHLQALAMQALSGIQNAYRPGFSPESTTHAIQELKRALDNVVQMLRKTGVGALPLIPAPMQAGVPRVAQSEDELLVGAEQAVKELYATLQRKQESAAVVSSLLGAPEHTIRK